MNWIHKFDLFLFDFDGLLVNTEHLHYQAYLNVLEKWGYKTTLSFANFFEFAHLNSTAWREALCAEIPSIEPKWKALYEQKKQAYTELLISGKVELLPGVQKLLSALQQSNIQRCVVTNSILEHIQLVKAQIPALKTIPHWITREDYEKPKPSPECYLKAIELYGKKGDRIIGFEDSARGLKALKQTSALALLICPPHHPLLEVALEGGGTHFTSIEEIQL